MSNPNLQAIGKRKNAPAKKQADWLFPSTETKSQTHGRSTTKQDKQLAKDLLERRADGSKAEPPSQLMAIVSTFLSENEFDATAAALQTERRVSRLVGEDAQDIPSLTTIYNEWLTLKAQSSVPAAKASVEENGKCHKKKDIKQVKSEKKKAKIQESSNDDSSDVEMVDAPLKKIPAKRSSSSSSPSSLSSSSSSSDSDADDEKEIPAIKASPPKSKPNLKRKASSESSTSDEAPKSKKVKKASSPSSSESSESSDSDSSSNDGDSKAEAIASSSSGSESSSSNTDSSSDDEAPNEVTDSESDSSTNSLAQKTPLPASDSDSSTSESDSDSDSSSASSKKPTLASESSATLSDSAKESASSSSDESSDSSSSSDSDAAPKQTKVIKSEVTATARKLSPPLPPDPVAKKPFKKTNVPFSRIPKDIKVDERLASNAYVPYDYAQKAHEDLIVTRGKGFTKEKNKKKRGSYRGGYIDVEGKKGIKFED